MIDPVSDVLDDFYLQVLIVAVVVPGLRKFYKVIIWEAQTLSRARVSVRWLTDS